MCCTTWKFYDLFTIFAYDGQTGTCRDLKVIELKLMEAEQKADFLKKQCIEKDEQVKLNIKNS